MEFVDCLGRTLKVGDRVGVAFSYSQASVGYIRIGTIVNLAGEEYRPELYMQWEGSDKFSPKMVFDPRRMVLL